MSQAECQEVQRDISAAAGQEECLSDETRAHLAHGCVVCEKLFEETKLIAELSQRQAPISSEAAAAFARSAIRDAEQPTRRVPLWSIPLVSASLSATVLILNFGLADPTEVTDSTSEGIPETSVTTSTTTSPLLIIPELPAQETTTLPVSISAYGEVLMPMEVDE